MRSAALATPLAFLDARGRRHWPVNGFVPSTKMCWSAFGALSGFAFGAVLATIPLATNIVTFGRFGTLAMAAVECAVIAVAFAALAAALSDRSEANVSRRT